MSKYFEKFKDPRWQKKRLEIMERDQWTCQDCGSTDRSLNVHHMRYFADVEIWDYEGSDLITLCEDCHKSCHNFFLYLPDYWHAFIFSGFFSARYARANVFRELDIRFWRKTLIGEWGPLV